MLKFATKELYWSLLDRGIDAKITKSPWKWHLKSIQDLIAFSYLDGIVDNRIAEIGGGNTRILPALARTNECTNIEKFEGQDGGPQKEIKLRRVSNVHCFVGDFSDQLEASYFDILISVSVVEHIPNPNLESFIKDCHRILRPNGLMIHLVDMYLCPERAHYNMTRTDLYRSAFDSGLFEPVEDFTLDNESDLKFHESYCSNPDNVMYEWNKVNSDLHELRANSQSVSLIWGGRALP